MYVHSKKLGQLEKLRKIITRLLSLYSSYPALFESQISYNCPTTTAKVDQMQIVVLKLV